MSNGKLRKGLARLPRKMALGMVGMADRPWPSAIAMITSQEQSDYFVTDCECPIDQPKV